MSGDISIAVMNRNSIREIDAVASEIGEILYGSSRRQLGGEPVVTPTPKGGLHRIRGWKIV